MNKTKLSNFITFIHYCARRPEKFDKRKTKRSSKFENIEVKLLLLMNETTLHTKTPKTIAKIVRKNAL